MKKLLLMMLGVMIALPALAHTFDYTYEGNTVTYTVLSENSKSVETNSGWTMMYSPDNIVAYAGVSTHLSGDLIIPEVVYDSDGTKYTVTSIGALSFYGKEGIESVTIPNSVGAIGQSAFNGCKKLKSVLIGDGTRVIINYAFYNCPSIKKVAYPNDLDFSNSGLHGYGYSYDRGSAIIEDGFVWGPNKETIIFAPISLEGEYIIPDCVQYIGPRAFYCCDRLTSVVSPNETAPTIHFYSFEGLYNTVEIIIPDNSINSYLSTNWALFEHMWTDSGSQITTFTDGVFNYKINGENSAVLVRGNYENMNTISISERVVFNGKFHYVTGIGGGSFAVCENIKSLVLPKKLEVIGCNAFSLCSGLTSVTIPNSVTTIGYNVFEGCSGLTSVTIGNSVKSIGSSAFYGCSGLTSVAIPNPVKSIGDYAFCECSGLTSVTIGNSVNSIGYATFWNCSSLTSVTFGSSVENIGEYAFENCKLTELVLSPATKTIGEGAFLGNSLENIAIGANVTEIGAQAFDGSNSLESVSITTLTPPAADNTTFSYYNCPLYVMPSKNDEVKEAYYNCINCWYRFDGQDLTPIKEVKVSGNKSINPGVGESVKLKATFSPANASLPYIFWRSTNTDIATVDHDGNVTRVSDEPGACQIIAETLYPDVTATVTIGDGSGIDDIDSEESIRPYDIYNLQGVCVKRNATDEDVKALSPGLYIIGGKKVII